MSFEDGGDLASFAAIAESTIVNKEVENVEATPESASPKDQEAMDVKEDEAANNESSKEGASGEQSEPSAAEATEHNSEDAAETDSSTAQLTSEQQRTYANLQRFF
ncbi:hypothetical protein OS493_028705 [Desmophyllum pertusum]|uniref:Uncharacterized protein n=1 Tax=Desmophyllum pertusum TaxID=174260 RepID=A0A9X0CF47_9CNID|nr:hypothetical protein OS493_028705 [Desmophyllum pertusum]